MQNARNISQLQLVYRYNIQLTYLQKQLLMAHTTTLESLTTLITLHLYSIMAILILVEEA